MGFQHMTAEQRRAVGAKGAPKRRGQKRVTVRKVRLALQKVAIAKRLIVEAEKELRQAFAFFEEEPQIEIQIAAPIQIELEHPS